MILQPTLESDVKGRKSVRWPVGRVAALGAGWRWRSPPVEKFERVVSMILRNCMVSDLVRLRRRWWMVSLVRYCILLGC